MESGAVRGNAQGRPWSSLATAAIVCAVLLTSCSPSEEDARYRVAVATFQHETCTFCPGGDVEAEDWRLRLVGDEVLESGGYVRGFASQAMDYGDSSGAEEDEWSRRKTRGAARQGGKKPAAVESSEEEEQDDDDNDDDDDDNDDGDGKKRDDGSGGGDGNQQPPAPAPQPPPGRSPSDRGRQVTFTST